MASCVKVGTSGGANVVKTSSVKSRTANGLAPFVALAFRSSLAKGFAIWPSSCVTDGVRPWTDGPLASHRTVHVKTAKTKSTKLTLILLLFISFLLLFFPFGVFHEVLSAFANWRSR